MTTPTVVTNVKPDVDVFALLKKASEDAHYNSIPFFCHGCLYDFGQCSDLCSECEATTTISNLYR
jgi:hypothetical protein